LAFETDVLMQVRLQAVAYSALLGLCFALLLRSVAERPAQRRCARQLYPLGLSSDCTRQDTRLCPVALAPLRLAIPADPCQLTRRALWCDAGR